MNTVNPKKKSRIGLKLVSIILTVLLWIYIGNQSGGAQFQNTIQAELQLINLADGLSIQEAPEKVSVRTWGNNKGNDKALAYVDLSGLDAGLHTLPVELEAVQGAMLTQVEPREVQIVLTRLQQREFRIDYRVSGGPPAGYELLDMVTAPESCIISGEADDLGRVSQVVCSVNLNNSNGIAALRLRPQIRDASGNAITEGLKVMPETVMIHAVVVEKIMSKAVAVKAEFSGGVAEGYQLGEVSVEPTQVSIISNSEVALTEVVAEAIDLTDKNQSFTQAASLHLPPGVKVFPSQVLVKVSIEKIPVEDGEQNEDPST